MEVRFRTRKLERCYEDSAFAERTFGLTIARSYIKAIDQLCDIDSFELMKLIRPRRFHQLQPRQHNRYAMDLTGNYRLIVEATDEPDQFNVLNVEDYHD